MTINTLCQLRNKLYEDYCKLLEEEKQLELDDLKEIPLNTWIQKYSAVSAKINYINSIFRELGYFLSYELNENGLADVFEREEG